MEGLLADTRDGGYRTLHLCRSVAGISSIAPVFGAFILCFTISQLHSMDNW